MADLRLERTPIDGLIVLHLPLHADARGWFKESWQRAKMTTLGLPDFGPVQQNVSHNLHAGTTRGIHAEPWDKLVSLTSGRVLGAWVDLRDGDGFGRTHTLEFGPDRAVFVPRGVGNAYQTLIDDTTYAYLVNDHWSPDARDAYTYVNLFDPALGLQWPVPRERGELSDSDVHHPPLADVVPVPPRRSLVLGAGGQLGRALLKALPGARAADSAALDITDADAVAALDLRGIDTLVNAAAFTGVDAAETADGRARAWAVNATGVGHLAALARERRLRLVHVSSDYVFDGTATEHDEAEPPSPLGVYGQSKAAGDLLAATAPQHWIVRTSWVIGEGKNFVRTMAELADKGANPSVVDDQVGRLTFTQDLAAGIAHLLAHGAAPGVYNLTNAGPACSWAAIAARVFELRGRDPGDVTRISTDDYARGRILAPRPANSALALDKIRATGFEPADADHRLAEYVAALP